MLSTGTVLVALFAYMALLFGVALWGDRRAAAGRGPANHPVAYALALAVYCTSWTFYGSVGKAAADGLLFLPIYLGATLSTLLWSWLLRRMVRLKNAHRITSVADFIAIRYGKSERIGAIATMIALVAVVPYIALQLKAILSAFPLIMEDEFMAGAAPTTLGLTVVAALIVFTIIFGVRKLDPTERHPGMVTALALESLVKLAAFVAVGIAITWGAFEGFGDIFEHLRESVWNEYFDVTNNPTYASTWATYGILSASAIVLLPRQFHVAVVENAEERHVDTASWLLPLYLLLINLFVFPIAVAGLLQGLPHADTYVLALPMRLEMPALALFVFLGGFSAATGMVMVSSMTVATMVTNHLLLPAAAFTPWAALVRRNVLRSRWLSVGVLVLISYFFERLIGESYMLVNIGILSFAAALQFAPPVLGALLWRRGNELGTAWGMMSGLALWAYTLFLPLLVRSGWAPVSVLEAGPWGVSWLRPEHLLGFDAFDPLTRGVCWSMAANLSCYVLGAAFRPISVEEQELARSFVGEPSARSELLRRESAEAYVPLDVRRTELIGALRDYFPEPRAVQIVDDVINAMGLAHTEKITIADLIELQRRVEVMLSGVIGTAGAHRVMGNSVRLSPRETQDLSEVYAKLLAELQVSPAELRERVDYHSDREELLQEHFEQLQTKIAELDREIAERRRAEVELKLLAQAVEQAVECVIITAPTGEIVYVNPAVERLSGYSNDELVGENVSIFESGQHDQAYLDNLWETLSRGETWSGTFVNRKKNGELYELESTVAPVRNEADEIINYVAVQRDRTRELTLERSMREAQKLEALGTLAGGIAHDFNNLLTPIISYAHLSQSRGDLDERTAGYFGQILAAANRAKELVQQILAFARRGEPRREPVHLTQLVEEALGFLRASLPATIEIRKELATKSPVVTADATQINQVLMNLCTNCAQAMGEEGGVITVELEDVEVDELAATQPDLKRGRYARISVTDTGPGIDPDILPQIFDPFFTTKPQGKGTGLGLAVVHGIVRSHSGAIVMENLPEGGARASVYLPVHRPRARQPSRVAQSVRGCEHILLVDNEQAVLQAEQAALTDFGYRVTAMSSGEEAMKSFAEEIDQFDAVITDLTMPGITGLTLAEKMVALRPDIPIILCTGYMQAVDSERAARCGIRETIPKPVTPDDLAAAVRRALDAGSAGED